MSFLCFCLWLEFSFNLDLTIEPCSGQNFDQWSHTQWFHMFFGFVLFLENRKSPSLWQLWLCDQHFHLNLYIYFLYIHSALNNWKCCNLPYIFCFVFNAGRRSLWWRIIRPIKISLNYLCFFFCILWIINHCGLECEFSFWVGLSLIFLYEQRKEWKSENMISPECIFLSLILIHVLVFTHIIGVCFLLLSILSTHKKQNAKRIAGHNKGRYCHIYSFLFFIQSQDIKLICAQYLFIFRQIY